ncbi:hypothetical protein ACTI_79630 [Actinoplanes sp. OR16]|uniref:hypothetical protein n=1 Tax=Actinoplanes sp. OR16 TaxID=946334 RepID=UPI000F6FC0D6|nr:hypothetical protein [Actinoplanes sp. OR16]BBH71278.1 hypothetical protein ACTI_79630 [Actinoplanes sp. OR16]
MSRPKRLRFAVPGIAALMLTTALTGCSSDAAAPGTGPGAAQPAAAGASLPAADGEIVLPIDAYAFTFPQMSQLDRARQTLVRDCMQRFGFTYPFDAARMEERERGLVLDFGVYGNKRRYGPTDAGDAGKYGYHSPSDIEIGKPKIDVAKEKENGSAAQQMVLTGEGPDGKSAPDSVGGQKIPEGGCVGEADTQISPQNALGDAGPVSQIARDSFDRSLADPEVTAAFKEWSSCMSGSGYNYPTPKEAGGDFSTDTEKVSAKEIAAAKADVACKEKSGLIAAWQGFEVAYQNAQIEKNAQSLQAAKAERDAQLKRAAEIVAKGS